MMQPESAAPREGKILEHGGSCWHRGVVHTIDLLSGVGSVQRGRAWSTKDPSCGAPCIDWGTSDCNTTAYCNTTDWVTSGCSSTEAFTIPKTTSSEEQLGRKGEHLCVSEAAFCITATQWYTPSDLIFLWYVRRGMKCKRRARAGRIHVCHHMCVWYTHVARIHVGL